MTTTGFEFFLPLLTYPDPTPGDGLLRAIDLAATLGGRLAATAHVVDIAPITNPLAAALFDYAGIAAATETASRERAAKLSHEVEHLAGRFALPVRIDTLVCRPESLGERLAAAARTSDYALSVVDAGSAVHLEVAESLIFGSGGPVVLFPAKPVATHLQTVVVAWDGSRAAGRAIRDALPVLRLASKVTVVTASTEKPIATASIAALIAFLTGHGIAATQHDIACDDRSIGEALQDDALAADAGLLVMGAYGHNRLREFVLGGATRSVLSDLRLPILMSH